MLDAAIVVSRVQLLKYPFSVEAREASSRLARDIPALLEILSDDMNEFVVNEAEARVIAALERSSIRLPDTGDEKDVLVYPTARLIVEKICGQLPGKAAIRLREYQAEAESKAVNRHLGEESNEFLMNLCEQSFNWNIQFMGGPTQRVNLPEYLQRFDFRILFTNYLDVAPSFRSSEWKLINRYVESGLVYVTRSELTRLASGKFKQLIIDSSFDVPELPERLAEAVQRIESELHESIRQTSPVEFSAEYSTALPPCIAQLHDEKRSGKSLAHSANFALAAFLLKIGMNEDQVLAVFSHSSDYGVKGGKIAKYQIEHIATKDYEAPSCTWMQRNLLCPVYQGEVFDPLCEYVMHPLSFYETRKWEIEHNIMNHSWYAAKRKKRQRLRVR